MATAWFESVAVAQRRAKRRLPKSVYSALIAGSEAGVTLADNLAAFGELGFAPHVADLPPARDMATTVMGQTISLPVLISPTGVQSVHPDGEIAVARAAAARGTAMGLELVRVQAGRGGRRGEPADVLSDLLVRLARADRRPRGARPRRGRGRDDRHARLDVLAQPRLGQSVDPRQHRPQGDGAARARGPRPPGVARGLGPRRHPTRPDRSEPDPARRAAADVLRRLRRVDADRRPPTWEDLRWLREQWDGPFMLKGITRVDDARHALDAGFSAISVSNHGGNNLDSTPASIRALPAIAEAVGDQIEVLLDGGIRRGWRRRQSARARRPRGHDRPRLPLGARRRRPARRRERARHHPQRDRLGAARARPREHGRAHSRRRDRPTWIHAPTPPR